MTKTCPRCKGVSDPSPSSLVRHDYRCKRCRAEALRDWKQRNHEHVANYRREWFLGNPQKCEDYKRRRRATETVRKREYRARNGEKVRARSRVQYALGVGHLTKLPCEDCGAPMSQAHHHDYSKPLDVHWLCARCHAAEHAAIRRRGAP